MQGTLVCGVVESAAGRRAVEVALQLSRRLELRLVLVNVVHVTDGTMAAGHDEIYWRHRQGAAAMLQQVAREHDAGGQVERRVVVGDIAGSLARIAADEAADMIVIGGSRRHRLGRRGTGRLVAQIDTETNVPVVVAMCTDRVNSRDREARSSTVLD